MSYIAPDKASFFFNKKKQKKNKKKTKKKTFFCFSVKTYVLETR